MPSEYGQTWRIEIGDGQSTEEFDLIGGETGFDWERTSKEIDESSKDDGYIAATGFGSQAVTFSLSGKLKLPDAGLQRLSTISKAVPPKCNIRVTKGAIVKYSGQVAVGNFSTSHPNDEVCTYKATAKACAVPTVDNLGATA